MFKYEIMNIIITIIIKYVFTYDPSWHNGGNESILFVLT